MTPEQFAQKIRTKYPGAYNAVPDLELAQRVIAKYPIYASQVQMPESSQAPQEGNAFSDAAGGLARGVAKGEVSTVKGLSELGNTIADQTVGRLVNLFTGKGFNPTNTADSFSRMVGGQENVDKLTKPVGAAENIGFGAEKIGEFALPGSKIASATKWASLLTRSLAEGATGATVAAAQNGALDKNALVTGAVSAALPGAGALLSKGGKALTEFLPTRLIRSALGQPKAEIMAGKDIAPFVLEKGKFGTADSILKGSQDSINSLSSTISKNLESTVSQGIKIDGKNVVGQVADIINQAGGAITPEEVTSVVGQLAPQTKGLLKKFFDGGLDLVESNKLRQALDQTLGDKGFLTSQLPYNKTILRTFDNSLRNSVKDLAPDGTKDAFTELSKEITLRDTLLEKTTAQSRNQVINGFDLLFGTGGFLGGGPVGAMVTVGAKKFAQSTIAKTGVARLLDLSSKLGPILEKLSPEEKAVVQALISQLTTSDTSSGGNNAQ